MKENKWSNNFWFAILSHAELFSLFARGFMLASVSFMNLHTLSAYIQVVILKHVIEINEDVILKTFQRSTYTSHIFISFLLPIIPNLSRKHQYDHWQTIVYPLEAA